MTYEYFVAGRTRNKVEILDIVRQLREAGKSVYCFLDNEYEDENLSFKDGDTELEMKKFESVENWRENETFKKIFTQDMEALRNSDKLMIVFPAGLSAHMEIGAAYGMGKPCYSIGEFEKPESLYLMLSASYDTVDQFLEQQL